MKILMSLTYYYPHWTGLTAYAQRLAEGLARRGHQVTVLSCRFRKDLAREENHNGVRILRLDSLRVLRRLVREHDVVQTHTPLLETFMVGSSAHAAGRKMLMTHHGDLVMPSGLWNQFVQMTVGYLLNRGASSADAISIHSQDYADNSSYLRPYLDKVDAIYPPTEIPEPQPEAVSAWRRELGLDGAKLVGFAGRFVEEKGFDYLLKAIPRVVEAYPDVKFVYAGDHQVAYEDFYGRCQQLIDANGEHVAMVGLITDRQRLANFYGMCDVFALPSRTDCFPSVQIESLYCGTPLVSTDIPGAREVLRVTGMGELVAPRNEDALAQGLIKVLADPAAYIKPQAEIRAVFDLEKSLDAYEALLGRLAV